MQNYDYSNFPTTPNAGKYSQWVPGQEAPRQPGFKDWFFNGVMTPFLSGFYTDSVAFADTDSFAKQVGERAQWQARQDAIDKAMREYLPGTGPFAPKNPPASRPRPSTPKPPNSRPRPTPPSNKIQPPTPIGPNKSGSGDRAFLVKKSGKAAGVARPVNKGNNAGTKKMGK
jgi:hypothetical protein